MYFTHGNLKAATAASLCMLLTDEGCVRGDDGKESSITGRHTGQAHSDPRSLPLCDLQEQLNCYMILFITINIFFDYGSVKWFFKDQT